MPVPYVPPGTLAPAFRRASAYRLGRRHALRLSAAALIAVVGAAQAAVTEATPCRDAYRAPPAACTLTVSGQITARDPLALTGILHRMDLGKTLLLVRFDSGGGDAHAAMALGRALRTAAAHGYVPPRRRCFSACVLALAGAATRAVHGRVGIHRPQPITAPALFPAGAPKRDDSAREIRGYLAEMQVSASLYDAMVKVPPKDMRILTSSELRAYGLLRDDPRPGARE
jgi:hypothetical protein